METDQLEVSTMKTLDIQWLFYLSVNESANKAGKKLFVSGLSSFLGQNRLFFVKLARISSGVGKQRRKFCEIVS